MAFQLLPFLLKTAAPALLSGAMQSSANRRARNHATAQNQQQREWYLDDRKNERAYNETQRDETRAYNEKLSDKEFARMNDLSAMRERVEAAGLNFSSYIRGGGNVNGVSTPFETMSTPNSPPAPVMTSASVGKSGGQAAVETFFNIMDQSAQEERDKLETDLLREEVKQAQYHTEHLKKKNWGYSIPYAVTETRNENTSGDDDYRDIGGNLLGSTADTYAPGREVKVKPYESSSGLIEINNRSTNGPIVVPGNDGEPWGVDEYATFLLFGGPQMAINSYNANIGKPFARWSKRQWDNAFDNSKRTKNPLRVSKRPKARGGFESGPLLPPLSGRSIYHQVNSRPFF